MPKGFGWPVLVNRQVRQCPLLAHRVLDCDDANGAQQTSVRVKGVRVVPGSSQARIRTVESQVRVGLSHSKFLGIGRSISGKAAVRRDHAFPVSFRVPEFQARLATHSPIRHRTCASFNSAFISKRKPQPTRAAICKNWQTTSEEETGNAEPRQRVESHCRSMRTGNSRGVCQK